MSKFLYTIYDNYTDEPLAIDLTADECVKQLGFKSKDSFYCAVSRSKKGTNKKYYVESREE